jgi:sialic acid synthase SpsE
MGATAVASGACILEKHFTYDRSAQGPDHAASLDFAGLKRYIANVRAAHQQRKYCSAPAAATGSKLVQDRERDVRAVSRQSIVARRSLPAGHRLTRDDITFKRPGTGIPPFAADEAAGQTLARPVAADRPIHWEDIGRAPPAEEHAE